MDIEERIHEELQDLKLNPHITNIHTVSRNHYEIEYSPKNSESPYKDKQYKIQIILPEKYPEEPPTLRFLNHIYHLNISPTAGEVRMSVLQDDWSSFLSLASIVESLDRILEQPQENYPADSDVYNIYKYKKSQYLEKVEQAILGQNLIDVIECQEEQYELKKDHINGNNLTNSIEIQEAIRDKIQYADSFYASGDPNLSPITKKAIFEQTSQKALKNMNKNAKEEGIVIVSDSRAKDLESKPQKSFSSPVIDKFPSQSHKNPTLMKINEMISVFIEEINQIEKQMKIIQNKQVYRMLEAARDEHIQMMKQLLTLSEEAKKKFIDNIRKQIKKM